MPERKQRLRISWSPKWGPDYIKWTASFIRDNKWRVDRIHDFQDLMQDAYLIFDKIAEAYPRVISPSNFFGLYRRAIINKFHDRSCAKTRHGKVEVTLPEDVADFFIGRIGEAGNAGYVTALINELPEEMRLVIQHMTSNEPRPHRSRNQPRENLSRKICRTMGLPEDRDPVKELKQLLTT
jgi:hypothetical protein